MALLLDDLLLAPMQGLLWVFQKIHDAARQEIAGEAEAITAELTELHRRLEAGSVGEAEFDERERVLLDRLDAIRERGVGAAEEEGDGEGDENGEDEED